MMDKYNYSRALRNADRSDPVIKIFLKDDLMEDHLELMRLITIYTSRLEEVYKDRHEIISEFLSKSTKYLFIGEQEVRRSIKRNVYVKDGWLFWKRYDELLSIIDFDGIDSKLFGYQDEILSNGLFHTIVKTLDKLNVENMLYERYYVKRIAHTISQTDMHDIKVLLMIKEKYTPIEHREIISMINDVLTIGTSYLSSNRLGNDLYDSLPINLAITRNNIYQYMRAEATVMMSDNRYGRILSIFNGMLKIDLPVKIENKIRAILRNKIMKDTQKLLDI